MCPCPCVWLILKCKRKGNALLLTDRCWARLLRWDDHCTDRATYFLRNVTFVRQRNGVARGCIHTTGDYLNKLVRDWSKKRGRGGDLGNVWTCIHSNKLALSPAAPAQPLGRYIFGLLEAFHSKRWNPTSFWADTSIRFNFGDAQLKGIGIKFTRGGIGKWMNQNITPFWNSRYRSCVCVCVIVFIILYQPWDLCCTFTDKYQGETYQKTWNTPQTAGETGMLVHSPITRNFSPDYCSDDLVIPCAQLMYSDGTLKSDILYFHIYIQNLSHSESL